MVRRSVTPEDVPEAKPTYMPSLRHPRFGLDQVIDAVGDLPIFYFVKRRIPRVLGKKADPLRELPPRSAELSITIGRAGTPHRSIAKSLLLIRSRSGRSRPLPARYLACLALHD